MSVSGGRSEKSNLGSAIIPTGGSKIGPEKLQLVGIENEEFGELPVSLDLASTVVSTENVEELSQSFSRLNFLELSNGRFLALGEQAEIAFLNSALKVGEKVTGSVVVYGLSEDTTGDIADTFQWDIVLDEKQSVLHYSVPRYDFEKFASVLSTYSGVEKIIEIDLIFIETSKNKSSSLEIFLERSGFSFGAAKQPVYTRGQWKTFIEAAYSNADFGSKETARTEIVSGESSEIISGDRVPVVTTVSNDGQTEQKVEYIQTGVSLKITGSVVEGDTIYIEYDLEVTSYQDGSSAPTFKNRKFTGTATGTKGSVVRISGLSSSQASKSRSLIGFRNSSSANNVDMFLRLDLTQ